MVPSRRQPNFLIEISKYDPDFRSEGFYMKDDWVSVEQIGEVIGGHTLSLEEYLSVEAAYCQVLEQILTSYGSENLIINQEPFFTVNEKLQESDDVSGDNDDQFDLERYLTGVAPYLLGLTKEDALRFPIRHRLLRTDISTWIRLCLRDVLGGAAQDVESGLTIHFAGEFYVFVGLPNLDKICFDQIQRSGLFIRDASARLKYEDEVLQFQSL